LIIFKLIQGKVERQRHDVKESPWGKLTETDWNGFLRSIEDILIDPASSGSEGAEERGRFPNRNDYANPR
jgi:hypothetical protein